MIWSRGMKFPNDKSILTAKRRQLLREGRYENKEHDALLRLARPKDRVLELGAGIGFISTALSRKVGVAAITVYEANPTLIPYIKTVHDLNGVTDVRVENAVLTDGPETSADFYIRRDFVASSLDNTSGGRIVETVTVPAHNVNDVLQRLNPTLLICDIEGGEASLLPAADLSGLRVAIIELHPKTIGPTGISAIFDAMSRAGLIYDPDTSRGKVVAFLRP